MSRSTFRNGTVVFSHTVEYALRAMVYLADQSPVPRTTRQIAEATLVPMPYLRKVLQCLALAELVTLTRGVHGGVALRQAPHELTILDVVNSVEPVQRITTCPLGLAAHGVRLCPLHKRLDQAMASVEEAFRRSTLAEVLAEPSKRKPLCEGPTNPPCRRTLPTINR